jgi:hypothetical protein
MQKWEYTTVLTIGDTIIRINGEKVGEVKQTFLNVKNVGETLHKFLNRAGDEGWEVTGISEANMGETTGVITTIILKRPKI